MGKIRRVLVLVGLTVFMLQCSIDNVAGIDQNVGPQSKSNISNIVSDSSPNDVKKIETTIEDKGFKDTKVKVKGNDIPYDVNYKCHFSGYSCKQIAIYDVSGSTSKFVARLDNGSGSFVVYANSKIVISAFITVPFEGRGKRLDDTKKYKSFFLPKVTIETDEVDDCFYNLNLKFNFLNITVLSNEVECYRKKSNED